MGLVTADELKDLNYRLDLLADAADNRIDIEEILKISRTALQLSDDTKNDQPGDEKNARSAYLVYACCGHGKSSIFVLLFMRIILRYCAI